MSLPGPAGRRTKTGKAEVAVPARVQVTDLAAVLAESYDLAGTEWWFL